MTQKGSYERKPSVFRDWISSSPDSRFPPAPHRYHLYVSLACPWAHRTLVMKRLKGLDDVIGHTAVDWLLESSKGWTFTDAKEGCQKDPFHPEFHQLRQVYELAMKERGEEGPYEGNITVPVLYDIQLGTIVNNESSEIIRMLNSEFNDHCATPEQAKLDFYPTALRPAIDSLNEWIYPTINNGVYRSGFARSQAAYDEAVTALFKSLDRVESILSHSRYLTGNQLTEADIRLFTTLIRFDLVYVGHFKCQQHNIREMDHTFRYMLELYQMPQIRSTVDFVHIQHHYYASHIHINPTAVVPHGPFVDLDQPHNRDKQTYDQSHL